MEYIRAATREFATGGRLALDVDSRSGNTVVEGQDTDRVTVQIVAHVWEESAEGADDALARIVGGIRQQGESLTIRTPEFSGGGGWFLFGRGTRVDYAITVPRATACRIASRSGRVEVARIDGPLEVEQRSGRTTVRGIAADVEIASRSGPTDVEQVLGRLAVVSHSGKVTVREVEGDVRVSSHSGSLQVERVGGSLEAQSHSGRLTAAEIAGDVRLEAKSGSVTLSGAGGGAVLRTISGSVTFRGAVLGSLEVTAVSGSITLDVDPQRPFFIEAESASGAIHSGLSAREGGPPPAGAPTVRARTTSGSIHINRYSG